MKKILNPWKIPSLTERDYLVLKKQNKLKSFKFKLKTNPIFSRRDLIVGHDNFNKWLKAAENKKKVSLVSGFMTSGNFHIGSLAVLEQMAYYQKYYNAKVFIPIADLEAICVRKTDEDKIKETLIRFLAHFNAAGLNIDKCNIYLQSQNLDIVRQASFFTSFFKNDDFQRIYDRELNIGEAFSSLVMVADILYPQLLSYDETLIILGIDELSHFILTKELIKLCQNFIYPRITYHKMISGLTSSKMGKSMPQNSILLLESEKVIEDKLNSLRNKDFPLSKNAAFNILQWYCKDDSIIERIKKEKNTELAKNLAIDHAIKIIISKLNYHKEKYKKFLPKAKNLASKFYKKIA